MTKIVALSVVVLWVACGIGAAGLSFAYFQGKYPTIAATNRRADLGNALMMGLVFGPIALFAEFFLSGFGEHGWRLR